MPTTRQTRWADFSFKSSRYEWLVIAGARAQFKGEGTINEAGIPESIGADHELFRFIVTGIDADLNETDSATEDRFRIMIWYEVQSEEFLIYDNSCLLDGGNRVCADITDESDLATSVLGGGSIKIHAAKGKAR